MGTYIISNGKQMHIVEGSEVTVDDLLAILQIRDTDSNVQWVATPLEVREAAEWADTEEAAMHASMRYYVKGEGPNNHVLAQEFTCHQDAAYFKWRILGTVGVTYQGMVDKEPGEYYDWADTKHYVDPKTVRIERGLIYDKPHQNPLLLRQENLDDETREIEERLDDRTKEDFDMDDKGPNGDYGENYPDNN